MRIRLSIVSALIAGLAISGCTSTPGATTPASIAESSTESPTATPAESAATTIAPDADLAALLPTTLGGAPLTVAEFTGEDLSNLPPPDTRGYDPIGNPDFGGGIGALAEELDVPLADIQGVLAYPPDYEPYSCSGSACSIVPDSVIAVRAVGADPAAMLDALALAIGGIQFRSGEVVPTEETVGGKTVSVMEFSSYSNYFYAIGEVAFIVKTADPAEAEDVLRQLP